MKPQPRALRRYVASARLCGGFSLIELSIVLFILGVMFGAVVRPVVAEFENRVLDDTRRVLDEARDALLGYVAAHGYFPCPASATSNGREDGANHANGTCGLTQGLLPAATLGLTSVDSAGFAVDGHRRPENRLRYAIFMQPLEGIANPFTVQNGMRRVGLGLLDQAFFRICGDATVVNPGVDCGVNNTLNASAVAVVWSLGRNAATGTTSPHELENTNGDRLFVSRPRSIVAGVEFDDMLTWITISVAVNRLVLSGRLP